MLEKIDKYLNGDNSYTCPESGIQTYHWQEFLQMERDGSLEDRLKDIDDFHAEGFFENLGLYNFWRTTRKYVMALDIGKCVTVAKYFKNLDDLQRKMCENQDKADEYQMEYFAVADKFMEYLNNLPLRIYVNLEPMNEKPVYKVTFGVKNGPIVLSDFVFDFGFFYYQLIL